MLSESKFQTLINDMTVNVSPITTKHIYADAKVITRKLDGKRYTVQPVKGFYSTYGTSKLRLLLCDKRIDAKRKKAIETVLRDRGALK